MTFGHGDVVVPPDDVANTNAMISAAIMDCLLGRCSHSVSQRVRAARINIDYARRWRA
jgi:hypothetical protein